MSLFAAPNGVLDKLEKIRRRFLWGGSEDKKTIHWVSWEKVIADKDKGGLGVGSLKSINISLLVKWLWRLRSESSTQWAKVITGVHKLHDKGDDYYSMKSMTGVWNNIAGIKRELEKRGIPHENIIKKHQGGNDISWRCEITGDGKYKVSALRHILEDNGHVVIDSFI